MTYMSFAASWNVYLHQDLFTTTTISDDHTGFENQSQLSLLQEWLQETKCLRNTSFILVNICQYVNIISNLNYYTMYIDFTWTLFPPYKWSYVMPAEMTKLWWWLCGNTCWLKIFAKWLPHNKCVPSEPEMRYIMQLHTQYPTWVYPLQMSIYQGQVKSCLVYFYVYDEMH